MDHPPYVCVKGVEKLRFYAEFFAIQPSGHCTYNVRTLCVHCTNRTYNVRTLYVQCPLGSYGLTTLIESIIHSRGTGVIDNHISTIKNNLKLAGGGGGGGGGGWGRLSDSPV